MARGAAGVPEAARTPGCDRDVTLTRRGPAPLPARLPPGVLCQRRQERRIRGFASPPLLRPPQPQLLYICYFWST